MAAETLDRAVPIPLEQKRFGYSIGTVHERALFTTARFVLAARADGPAEQIRQRFPAQSKIGPAERIAELVRQGLPGIPVIPMPVVPREIPFHAGSAYFELDQTHDLWNQLK